MEDIQYRLYVLSEQSTLGVKLLVLKHMLIATTVCLATSLGFNNNKHTLTSTAHPRRAQDDDK